MNLGQTNPEAEISKRFRPIQSPSFLKLSHIYPQLFCLSACLSVCLPTCPVSLSFLLSLLMYAYLCTCPPICLSAACLSSARIGLRSSNKSHYLYNLDQWFPNFFEWRLPC